jgi:predicted ATPase
MSATLDWSYGLLSEAGQRVLRHLAIFDGSFTLRAAVAITADACHSKDEIVEQVTKLTEVSLVIADRDGLEPRFRLLETTRAYALEKLAESREGDRLLRGRAEHFRNQLETVIEDVGATDDGAALDRHEIGPSAPLSRVNFYRAGASSIGASLAAPARTNLPTWLRRTA